MCLDGHYERESVSHLRYWTNNRYAIYRCVLWRCFLEFHHFGQSISVQSCGLVEVNRTQEIEFFYHFYFSKTNSLVEISTKNILQLLAILIVELIIWILLCMLYCYREE